MFQPIYYFHTNIFTHWTNIHRTAGRGGMFSRGVYTSTVLPNSSQQQLIRYAAAPFPTSDTDQTCLFVFLTYLPSRQITPMWRHIRFRLSAVSLASMAVPYPLCLVNCTVFRVKCWHSTCVVILCTTFCSEVFSQPKWISPDTHTLTDVFVWTVPLFDRLKKKLNFVEILQ